MEIGRNVLTRESWLTVYTMRSNLSRMFGVNEPGSRVRCE